MALQVLIYEKKVAIQFLNCYTFEINMRTICRINASARLSRAQNQHRNSNQNP